MEKIKDKLTTKISNEFSLKSFLEKLPKLEYEDEGFLISKKHFKIIKKLAVENSILLK